MLLLRRATNPGSLLLADSVSGGTGTSFAVRRFTAGTLDVTEALSESSLGGGAVIPSGRKPSARKPPWNARSGTGSSALSENSKRHVSIYNRTSAHSTCGDSATEGVGKRAHIPRGQRRAASPREAANGTRSKSEVTEAFVNCPASGLLSHSAPRRTDQRRPVRPQQGPGSLQATSKTGSNPSASARGGSAHHETPRPTE